MTWSRAIAAAVVTAGLAACAPTQELNECHLMPKAMDATTQLPCIRFVRDCLDCPELAVLPAGQYVMGYDVPDVAATGPHDHYYRTRLGPAHCVTIAHPFAIGRAEVSIGEWRRCQQDGVCRPLRQNAPLTEEFPAHDLDWDMAQDYVRWLSAKTGNPYRLHSEAEWEYATWGGIEAPEALEWAAKNGHPVCAKETETGCRHSRRLYPVRSHLPNPFGLYDMIGNASEWVDDCAHAYASGMGDQVAVGAGDCSNRMMRGLQSGMIPMPGRLWFRDGMPHDAYSRMPERRDQGQDGYGFRVARDIAAEDTLLPQ